MERSSPLAALQPSCIQPPWSRPISEFDQRFLYPSGSFNFRDLSMLRTKSDFFALHPIRGSSPTASLAADLSQNFNIDQTPQAATPRRSLFTNINNGGLGVSHQPLLTPPILSSSPGRENDPMECSPLPHKPPFSKLNVNLLPTPEPTPMVDEGQFFGAAESKLLQPAINLSPPCRKSSISRPSLRKVYSSHGLPARPSTAEAPDSAFIFGNLTRLSQAPLLESFAESPPSERKASIHMSNPIAPPPRLALINSGSPVSACGVKRPIKRQGLGRRTQSLQYTNHVRPFRQEKRCCTQGAIVTSRPLDSAQTLKLPHFRSEDDGFDAPPRISQDTMVALLEGKFTSDVPDFLVVDCRFEYEYQGGHIQGAINFNDKDTLKQELFRTESLVENRTIILHCEYSAHRAPLMAKVIREEDRNVNQDRYPYLSYPEMYILDGGYSAFFSSHSSHCYPQSYKRMDAEEHAQDCERGMAKVKRRAKLSRAQTYAFGQHPLPTESTTDYCGGLADLPVVHHPRPLSAQDSQVMMNIDFEQAVVLEENHPQALSKLSCQTDSC